MKHLKYFTFYGIVLLLSLSPAVSESVRNEMSVGAGSDVVNGFAASADGKLFLATDNGLYVSPDDGFNWEKINSEFANLKITAFKEYKNKLYAGTSDGIYLSSDNGATWNKISTMCNVASMAFNPKENIIADGYNRYNNRTIVISFDGGKTWEETHEEVSGIKLQNNPRGDVFRKGEYYLYRLDYMDQYYCWQRYCWQYCTEGFSYGEARSFTILNTDDMMACSDKAVLYSKYAGRAWQKVSDVSFGTLGCDQAGRFFGDYKISLDSGKTWKMYVKDTSFHNINLIYSSKKGFVYYTSSTDGLLFTTDDGLTWNRSSLMLKETSINELHFFDNIMFAATEKGVYFSKDKTKSWYSLNNGLGSEKSFVTLARNNAGDFIAYLNNSGFWTYSFSTKIWTKNSTQPNKQITKIIKTSSGEMMASSKSGALVSNDNGQSWTDINSGLFTADLTYIYEGTDLKIYAATRSGYLFRYDPQSTSWTALNEGRSIDYEISCISQNPKGDIFISTLGGGIFILRQGMNYFVESNLQIRQYDLSSVYAFNDKYILAGWNKGFYAFSSDNSGYWTKLPKETYYYSDNNPVKSIITDNQDTFYVAVKNEGVLIVRNVLQNEVDVEEYNNDIWQPLPIHSANLSEVRFGPAGDSTFFTCAKDGTVRKWLYYKHQVYGGLYYRIIQEIKLRNAVSSFDFSKDFKRIVIGTIDTFNHARSYIYDFELNKYVGSFNPLMKSGEPYLRMINNIVRFSPDDQHVINAVSYNIEGHLGDSLNTLASSSDLIMWNAISSTFEKDLKNNMPGSIVSLKIADAGTMAAVAFDSLYAGKNPKIDSSHSGGAALLDFNANSLQYLTGYSNQRLAVSNAFLSRDNTQLIARSSDSLYVWDFPSGSIRRAIRWKNLYKVFLSNNNVYIFTQQGPYNMFELWALQNQRFYTDFNNLWDISAVDFHKNGSTMLLSFSTGITILDWQMLTDAQENDINVLNNEIVINPNPSTNYIEISYSPLEKGGRGLSDSIKIYNVFGEEQFLSPAGGGLGGGSYSQYSILTTQYSKLDVSALPPGLYFVRVGVRLGKFVKL